MSVHMILRIDPDLKEKYRKLAIREGKTMTEKTIEMIEAYIQENDFEAMVDRVWKDLSREMKGKGSLRKDVKRKISEARGIGTER